MEEIRVSERGGFARVDLRADELNQTALGWACPADQLLHSLNAALLQNPNISVHWSTAFKGADGSAPLNTETLHVIVEHNDTTTSLRCRLLIGADGQQSRVRDAYNLGFDELDYGQAAIVAAVTASHPRPHTAFEHFTRRGPLAFVFDEIFEARPAADALKIGVHRARRLT